MVSTAVPQVEASDIQASILRPRPSPYRGEYIVLRIGEAAQGHEMLRRVIPYVAPAVDWWVPSIPAWLGIAFTYHGLEALGLPKTSLDSFPEEFRQGMAARADLLNDVGDNAPTNWEYPFGTTDMHIGLSIFSRDDQSLETVLEQVHQSLRSLPQISVIYRLKFHEFPDGRNPFGFKDGLHNPHIEGTGVDPPPGYAPTVKAGEFIMGYPDELGQTATKPEPEVLRRNGTFIAFRKFHTRVAAFRKYLCWLCKQIMRIF